ncbi:sigma-70 family RNA polymerase sigma factor [Nocardia transvalensis]|uniref:sigma-70 family RNA polymerase sigma factor n=1 Tax=Nocardia transvalensis TaxID=37333 RepID=UPI0018959D52|nr:sigma-70 family RNA polymerase sigma factor [Nocardia transvalensis]MBF6332888.1 sigma-70 family RNA polymerase sigma factor [Nocardia transvalensis]
MSGLRPASRASVPPCSPRCARLCTEAGLAAVLATDQGLLHWRAVHRLGDAGLAEHAVQETLLRAWRACATYDPGKGSVRTWLLSIERNVLTDISRMRAVRPAETSWDEAEEWADLRWPRPDFTEALADAMLVADLLAGLPDPQRDAVIQVILHDRAYQDVAADLGVPVGTVKTRVHYALRSLRKLPLGA